MLPSACGGYTSALSVSVSSTAGPGAFYCGSICDKNIYIKWWFWLYFCPSFVFTSVNGRTGASATPTFNSGVPAAFTASFGRTYTYTWNVPDININDFANLSAINIIETGFSKTSPFTYRILVLQYDSCDNCLSDYRALILSVAQNINVCSYGSLGGNNFCIILTPQTIWQIK